MAKKQKVQIKEDLTCNLIPMVDIMFLLLLFFILGADMTQREQAELILPTASEVKENEKVRSEAEPLTTINIQHRQDGVGANCPVNKQGGFCRDEDHWVYVIRGKDFPRSELKEALKVEAEASMEPDVDPVAGVRLSSRKVIIRADRTAPYGDIQKVIETCGQVHIYKIEVGAAVPTVES